MMTIIKMTRSQKKKRWKKIYWCYRQEILLFVILAFIAVSKLIPQSQSITITAVSDRRGRFLLSQLFQQPSKLRVNWECHKILKKKKKQELRHACIIILPYNNLTILLIIINNMWKWKHYDMHWICSDVICIIKLGKTIVPSIIACFKNL